MILYSDNLGWDYEEEEYRFGDEVKIYLKENGLVITSRSGGL